MRRFPPPLASAAGFLLLVTAGLAVAAALAAPPQATVTGTVSREGQTADIHHLYLFRGPDPDGDETKTIRRLVFWPTDIGAKLGACEDMNCTSRPLFEPGAKGLIVDLLEGDWSRYMAQLPGFGMSGSFDPAGAFEFTSDEPGRVAGTLRWDGSENAAPVIDLVFDAPLVRPFDRARGD